MGLVPEHLKRSPNTKMFLRTFWYRATRTGVLSADEMHVYTLARCAEAGLAWGGRVGGRGRRLCLGRLWTSSQAICCGRNANRRLLHMGACPLPRSRSRSPPARPPRALMVQPSSPCPSLPHACSFLVQLALLDLECSAQAPSLLAAASLSIGLEAYGKQSWPLPLQQFGSYLPSDLEPLKRRLVELQATQVGAWLCGCTRHPRRLGSRGYP